MEEPTQPINTPKYTTEQIQQHVAAWKQSGLSKKDYSSQHGVKYGTLKGWIYRQEKRDEAACARPYEGAPSFVAVQLDAGAARAASTLRPPVIELTLPAGGHLCFYQPVSAQYLRELLEK